MDQFTQRQPKHPQRQQLHAYLAKTQPATKMNVDTSSSYTTEYSSSQYSSPVVVEEPGGVDNQDEDESTVYSTYTDCTTLAGSTASSNANEIALWLSRLSLGKNRQPQNKTKRQQQQQRQPQVVLESIPDEESDYGSSGEEEDSLGSDEIRQEVGFWMSRLGLGHSAVAPLPAEDSEVSYEDGDSSGSDDEQDENYQPSASTGDVHDHQSHDVPQGKAELVLPDSPTAPDSTSDTHASQMEGPIHGQHRLTSPDDLEEDDDQEEGEEEYSSDSEDDDESDVSSEDDEESEDELQDDHSQEEQVARLLAPPPRQERRIPPYPEEVDEDRGKYDQSRQPIARPPPVPPAKQRQLQEQVARVSAPPSRQERTIPPYPEEVDEDGGKYDQSRQPIARPPPVPPAKQRQLQEQVARVAAPPSRKEQMTLPYPEEVEERATNYDQSRAQTKIARPSVPAAKHDQAQEQVSPPLVKLSARQERAIPPSPEEISEKATKVHVTPPRLPPATHNQSQRQVARPSAHVSRHEQMTPPSPEESNEKATEQRDRSQKEIGPASVPLLKKDSVPLLKKERVIPQPSPEVKNDKTAKQAKPQVTPPPVLPAKQKRSEKQSARPSPDQSMISSTPEETVKKAVVTEGQVVQRQSRTRPGRENLPQPSMPSGRSNVMHTEQLLQSMGLMMDRRSRGTAVGKVNETVIRKGKEAVQEPEEEGSDEEESSSSEGDDSSDGSSYDSSDVSSDLSAHMDEGEIIEGLNAADEEEGESPDFLDKIADPEYIEATDPGPMPGELQHEPDFAKVDMSQHFEFIQDPELKRLATKLHKRLNIDPWDATNTLKDDYVQDFVQEHPLTCQVQYFYNHFNERLFPLNMLCALNPSVETVEATYAAFPPAADQCDPWIGSPLHYACAYKASIDVVQFLLTKKPMMMTKLNDLQRTPLHLACVFKATMPVIQLLIKKNPSVLTMKDRNGCTPLHLAAENGAATGVVNALIRQNKSCCMSRTNSNMTPLHLACARWATRPVVKTLMDADRAAIEAVDDLGRTPLHIAVQYGAPLPIVQMVVKVCPDLAEERTDRGETPLDLAKKHQASPDVTSFLSKV